MNASISHEEPVKLLWTGGADSTFQLLRLLLIDKRPVEPFYLIDEGRRSTGAELLAMKRIRRAISSMDGSARSRILPTRLFLVSEVQICKQISDASRRIIEKQFMGSQYAWIAGCCEQHAISKLQLCLEKGSTAGLMVTPLIDAETAMIDGRHSRTDEYSVFRYFEFPVLDLTKQEMAQIANAHGWTSILEMTWFCHRPIKNQPCGRCNPCKTVIKNGLGRRIPLRRRWWPQLASILHLA